MKKFEDRENAKKAFVTQLANLGYQGDLQQAGTFMEYYFQLHDGINDAKGDMPKARDTIAGTAKMLTLSAMQMMPYLPPDFGSISLSEDLKKGVILPDSNISAIDGIYKMASATYNKTCLHEPQVQATDARGR